MESPLLNLNLDIFRKRAGKNQDLNNCFWGLTLSHRLLKYFDNSTLIFISTEIYDFLAHVLNSWFVLWSVFPEFLWHFLMISHNVAIYTLLTHSSVLAWRIPGTGEPGGLPSLGSHRVGHDWSDLAAAAAHSLMLCTIMYVLVCLDWCMAFLSSFFISCTWLRETETQNRWLY